MIPKTLARDRYGNNAVLRHQARDDAYKRMYFDIYRSLMRYDPQESQELLDLSDQDVEFIKLHYKREEESELPVKFVTINLPKEADLDQAQKCLERCLKKVYVGYWSYAFELGKDSSHPHYHVYFVSTVKWLAKSRIIKEWSKVFSIEPNFVHVKPTSKEQMSNLEGYISKEKIFKKNKNKM